MVGNGTITIVLCSYDRWRVGKMANGISGVVLRHGKVGGTKGFGFGVLYFVLNEFG